MKRKFINVGFEFTASTKKGKKITNTALHSRCGKLSRVYNYTSYLNKNVNKVKISKYDWINKNFEQDDCGCEIATPIIKNKKDVTRYFKEFNSFAKSSNLSIDIDTAANGLGGCHIHLGIGFMPMAFRKRFLKNVAIWLTNHPQLNWAFNDPNDNVNANSLLTQQVSSGRASHPFASTSFNIEISCYESTDGCTFTIGSNGLFQGTFNGTTPRLLAPFRDDKTPYKAFMSNPTKIFLKKKFALRYNEDFKTLELRIFDMPKTLKQHLLHYEVAMAIFNRCYEMTAKNDTFTLTYNEWHQYIAEPLNVALLKFDNCMKVLGIAKNRTKNARENIITRYKWDRMSDNACYLL
jgi:hypothetical protein